MGDTFRGKRCYAVREPDPYGGPYGPSTTFGTWAEAKAHAETLPLAFVDRLTWVPYMYEGIDIGDHEVDDNFYAECYEGTWLFEGATLLEQALS